LDPDDEIAIFAHGHSSEKSPECYPDAGPSISVKIIHREQLSAGFPMPAQIRCIGTALDTSFRYPENDNTSGSPWIYDKGGAGSLSCSALAVGYYL
jgi:hypothetical protein